jgi:hypothetical protein
MAFTNSSSVLEQDYGETISAVEAYIRENEFWDPFGVMYAYIDRFTGKPFERDFITPIKVPRRADIDPWSYWAYEDTVETTGAYIYGLVSKYRVTGDLACLELAQAAWRSLRNIYYASQVYGIGSFLRPYGGFENMGKWTEPLGTDQASPMFGGLYFYMKYADKQTREEISDVLLKSITWYEQQGFRYLYYKNFIHEWAPLHQHAAAYYLPAIAWAAEVTGDERWRSHLDAGFERFNRQEYNLYESLNWGTEIAVLKGVLGDRIGDYFTEERMGEGFAACQEALSLYSEPGMTWRIHPESAEPGFKPYVQESFNSDVGFGFAGLATVHGGRTRPRREMHFLCGLAELGYPGAYEQAVEILGCRRNVPEDFLEYNAEDYDDLPETVHLYARGIGAFLFEWWRNYWWLRDIEKRNSEGRPKPV